jgi:NAD(P)-dependent dehydrogenase (short-subunit alcohol dehydrogenase family)
LIFSCRFLDFSATSGRIGTDEDMAGAAIYLASRAGDYAVGATIAVDGGIVYANAGIKGEGWDS